MPLFACPDCGKTISTRAPSCPHCGRGFGDGHFGASSAADRRQATQRRGCFSQVGSGCLIAIGVVVVLGCMGIVGSALLPSRPREAVNRDAPELPAAAPSPSPPTIQVGDTVTLYLEGNTNLFLATTDDSWNEMLDAQNAKSNGLMKRLILQGKVALVPNGSQAIVVKRGFASTYVALADGTEGWIQSEFVKEVRKGSPIGANPYDASNTPPSVRDEPSEAVQKVEKKATDSPQYGPPKESLHDVMKAELDRKEAEKEAEFEAFQAKAAKDREGRADSLVKSGKNLEELGNTNAALEFYRRVVKDYPGTRGAKQAAERIKRLDKK